MRNYPLRICKNCGIEYRRDGVKFCSHKCADTWRKNNFIPKRKPLVCENCKKDFYAEYKYKKRRFCSIPCRADFVKKQGSPKRIYPIQCHAGKWQTKYANIKRRSQNLGLPFLSAKEFVTWYSSQPKICVYCGIPSEIWEKIYSSSQFKFDLTIDRKDVKQGYIELNMALCCGHCNVVKNNILSFEEMKDVAEKYIKPKWQKKLLEVESNV